MAMFGDLSLIQGSHNQFPPDTEFPQIEQLSAAFKELCAIIAKYNAQRHFRLRLLHRHTTIPEGQILLGTGITGPSGFWTRPTPISDIDLRNIHPHIISVDTTGCVTGGDKMHGLLFPSEFREGPSDNLGDVESDFFREFSNFLMANGLGDVFGLEVVRGQLGKMIEFSFDIGSLLLGEDEVNSSVTDESSGHFKLQETGWTVTVEDGTVCKTGETRCVTYTTGHIKFTDSKATGVWDAVKILRDEGVLVG